MSSQLAPRTESGQIRRMPPACGDAPHPLGGAALRLAAAVAYSTAWRRTRTVTHRVHPVSASLREGSASGVRHQRECPTRRLPREPWGAGSHGRPGMISSGGSRWLGTRRPATALSSRDGLRRPAVREPLPAGGCPGQRRHVRRKRRLERTENKLLRSSRRHRRPPTGGGGSLCWPSPWWRWPVSPGACPSHRRFMPAPIHRPVLVTGRGGPAPAG